MILLELFWTFFKIGAFTFGGGYAMLPLIQSEVERMGWLGKAELIDFIAVSESTPGPFAINISTYVGRTVGGFFGAVCSTLGVVVPSFVIILIVARFYAKFKENKTVAGVMSGLKPAVIGLIGSAIVSVGTTVLFPNGYTFSVFSDVSFYISAGITVLCSILAFKKVHPILIICLSAAIGIAAGYGLQLNV
ncbi:MAG: chromate transporter [Clostridia bacterium]|nr:chromate transporter [Clostridia bacterium]